MKGATKIFCTLILASLALFSHAQSKSELQRQRDELNKKIAYTKKLINESKKSQESVNRELSILNQQINYRQQLVNNINAEIREIDNDISDRQVGIETLNEEIGKLKDEYAKMVYQSYKTSSTTDKLMFIFASQDFSQAYGRLKMMQHYAEVRRGHMEDIIASQSELQSSIDTLEVIKADKLNLASEKQVEKEQLSSDIASQQSRIQQLKNQESKLRKEQQDQEEERRKINRAIQRIIEEELRAEKEKNNGVFTLTPAGKIVSENFEKNKGQLPWPVLRGVITQKFGKQPHPSLPGIVVDLKGIDIATDPDSKVYSIFNGEVTSVFSIPGAGQNVIVTHGAYKTVYTNLKTVTVSKGQSVTTSEQIGTVLSEGNSATAHLEIWKISQKGGTPLNPEYWISKL